ncbi:MAG: M1 family metallopeptidase [Maribacter sp.]|nr:M1 family metallopeptidase [Maribacter sp.]
MRKKLFSLFFLICSWVPAQHQDKVNFLHADVAVAPIPEKRQLNGSVTYTLDVLADVDSIFLDAKNLDFSNVRLNSRKVDFINNGKTISVKKKFKKGKTYHLELSYSCFPKQTVYFIGWADDDIKNNQIWTQGQGKYTSYWLPSFDDMTEKVEFDLKVSFQPNYEVIANGKLASKQLDKDDRVVWTFDMEKPMSSYLLAFAIGHYKNEGITSSSGIPIENYYYPNDSLRIEPTYRFTKAIFDFMEAEIGVGYPWQIYKQLPVRDFLYAGMENTGTTLFSDGYVIDSTAFIDKNYVNVNAHELAHQWFGDMVTELNGNHHWLHEGFATYYAYLAEKKVFGDEYVYWKLYDTAKQLIDLSKEGKGEALTNPKASSLTFYEKGAWALLMLQNEVGEETFKNGIRKYLEKFQFQNVTISDFMSIMEEVSGRNLSTFKRVWLEETRFAYEESIALLKVKSIPVAQWMDLQWQLTTSLEKNEKIITDFWNKTASDELKKRIIIKYYKSLSTDFLKEAFKTQNAEIRQALSFMDGKYALNLKQEFTSLLEDKSYITVESALYQLWINYPLDRADYLNKTKGIIGLPNKNVRLLWLTLAILTSGYEAQNTKHYFDELSGYTSPSYSIEVRQVAFQYLKEAFGFTDQNLLDLLQATTHYSWQFKQFARDLIDTLLKDTIYQERIGTLLGKLNPEEKRYIQTKLNEL